MKVSGSGRVIGGRSLWGNTFYLLIKEFGWTLDYILWGISFANVQMLLSDATEYFSGDGKNKNKKVISADDPRNREYIMSLVNE